MESMKKTTETVTTYVIGHGNLVKIEGTPPDHRFRVDITGVFSKDELTKIKNALSKIIAIAEIKKENE
jgi:hypothetical protein